MRPLVLLLLALLGFLPLPAKRLPVKTYTTADGLARDHVLCIVQDSHSFLWFCTAEGLSRFDGYQFTNYHTAQGLPSDAVLDFLETSDGVYWVVTRGGLARFHPAGATRFQHVPLNYGSQAVIPLVLREDHGGGIWCGTAAGAGLFFLGPHDSAFRHVDLPFTNDVTALLVDRRGALWIGSDHALYRRDRDGAITTFTTADGLPDTFIMALREDRQGRLWVGTRGGLVRMDDPAGRPHLRVYNLRDGLPGFRLESLLEAADGTIWAGTSEGLAEWIPGGAGGREFQSYTVAEGLSARAVGALASDRDGNLWIGTFGSGVMKVARSGFSTYTAADGVPSVSSLMESRAGELCILYREHGRQCLARFDGRRFDSILPAWPPSITYFGWGRGQAMVQDASGEWWIATGQGLCRFARTDSIRGLAGQRPKAMYTTRDGLPGNDIFNVFADSRGDIWAGTIGLGQQDGLVRWDRGTGRFQVFSESDNLPPHPLPIALAEDQAGNVWVALYHGGMARFRRGCFTYFGARDGLTSTVTSLYVDSSGRLWAGTYARGLIRVESPSEERPRFTFYGTSHGLGSNAIEAITGDNTGRIFAATGRGIDSFDPQPSGLGRIQHYTTSDGIAPGELDLAYRDRAGALWFSTPLGLSQFVPPPVRPRSVPAVLITGLSTGGVPHPLSDLGESRIQNLHLPRTPLRVDFVGLDFSPGEALRYQYMLDGADRTWSTPTDQRTVLYASLAAGSYHFRVRALTADGAAGSPPAEVEFTILPPLWRTWWFLLSSGALAGLIVFALHRYRLSQLLAVANLRTRIATDLHDDIGASLSQIAVLSEVAKRQSTVSESSQGAALSEIAGISRELVDSMSDIVWAINPDHDRLSNLIYRMRRFATDVLGSQQIMLQFRSSLADQDLKITANVRRQVYLIFKEAIHNISRHSGASQVEVDLYRTDDLLILRLHDDGKGFDPAAAHEGNGLANIGKRAAALGSRAHWDSAPGRGCTFKLAVRLQAASLSVLRGK